MKLEIYGDTPSEEKVALLKLERVGTNRFSLVVVDKNGKAKRLGALLSVNASTGKISRYCRVSPDLGFSLDHLGRVELEGEG